MSIEIYLPLRTRTPGNGRRHWAVDAKEAREQRNVSKLFVRGTSRVLPPFPVKVTLTRIGPRKMDQQNLGGALKHIIDGIADAYGVDDGDERWEFIFKQEKNKDYGVRVLIEEIQAVAVG
jgi:hypothetical protein